MYMIHGHAEICLTSMKGMILGFLCGVVATYLGMAMWVSRKPRGMRG